MLLDQRRGKILDFVEEKGFASLQDLVEHFEASESTIRRDLEHLDTNGHIRRTRGGASYVGESLMGFEDRSIRALSEKQRIGRAVAEMIEPGESILIDGGSTTLEVARHLVRQQLQVVTNSLPIVNLLAGAKDIELVMIGGYVFPKTGVALGPMAMEALDRINVRKLIMGTGGITEQGLFNSNTLLVDAERKMLDSAEQVILVADSGKLGHVELVRLCGLDRVDQLVIDDGISKDWVSRLEGAGIKLRIVA